MQLLEIVLYNADGRIRTVEFRLGALNILTGESKTGKSALLAIVEYCLGRDSMRVFAGPITRTTSWYGCLWQFDDGSRAFSARPAPATGNASTSVAMLERGGPRLESPPLSDLTVNCDSRSLRTELGQMIGITEAVVDQPEWSLRSPYSPSIGHAALLCLQAQNEIANPSQLFHRQDEDGISRSLQDTLPYFLGAMAVDQGMLRVQLRQARRDLRRAENALQFALQDQDSSDSLLRGLLREASAAGLIGASDQVDRASMVELLQTARYARKASVTAHDDSAAQDARFELQRVRDTTQEQMQSLLASRELLLNQRSSEGEYDAAIGLHIGRLSSLELIPSPIAEAPSDASVTACPLCTQSLPVADPTATQLAMALQTLRDDLIDVRITAPRRGSEMQRLENEIGQARQDLIALNSALDALDADASVTESRSAVDSRDFVRGRIDASLSRVEMATSDGITDLERRRDIAQQMVQALEDQLDPDNEREQLTSRLLRVGRDMTRYAEKLNLEHASESVRLDLSRLTVVTDTPNGPIPLYNIGSAANWVGYHLITHLALHRHFLQQDRPVPHFLMLDQPTQAYYPAEANQRSGLPTSDADRVAVAAMFALMLEVVQELAPRMQIIVCDHALLDDEWFTNSVVHNWRGEKLIPSDWLDKI